MIVVLRNPSLADRIAEAGGTATESAMRQWTAGALAAQKQVAARLSREGIQLVPDFVYTRTFNGFAAPIDGAGARAARARRGRARRLPGAGRLSGRPLGGGAAQRGVRPGAGRRADVGIPRFDGAGITVALLDTGVDVTHPFIRDRLLDGIDMLDPERRAVARAHPDEPTRVEQHGTAAGGADRRQRRARAGSAASSPRLGPADPGRGLAAERRGRLLRLRAHRPAARGDRARGRPRTRTATCSTRPGSRSSG